MFCLLFLLFLFFLFTFASFLAATFASFLSARAGHLGLDKFQRSVIFDVVEVAVVLQEVVACASTQSWGHGASTTQNWRFVVVFNFEL